MDTRDGLVSLPTPIPKDELLAFGHTTQTLLSHREEYAKPLVEALRELLEAESAFKREFYRPYPIGEAHIREENVRAAQERAHSARETACRVLSLYDKKD